MRKGKNGRKYKPKKNEIPYSSDEDAGIDMSDDNYSETFRQSDLRSYHAEHRRTEVPYPADKYAHQVSAEEDAHHVLADELSSVIDMPDDNYLGTFGQWDLKCNHDDAANEIQNKIEEKALKIIDALNARASEARAEALVSLRNVLQRRYLAHLLSSQRVTLADHVTRALRRGKDGERKAAAAVAPILALQIGEEGTEECMADVRPALAAAAVDKTASLETRIECCASLAVLCYLLEEDLTEILKIIKMYETIFSGSYLKCCASLAVLCYLLEEDLTEILKIIKMYETIFSGSYLKGDGTVKVSGSAVEEGTWHAAALDAWALLLLLLEPHHAKALLADKQPSVARLTDLLNACSLEVRLAAGGALVSAHERADDEHWPEYEDLLVRLQQLTRDSHKYRAKRDRKLQRATFRDILRYFKEGTVEELKVRIGVESIVLEGWGSRAAYGALAGALGAGLVALTRHSPPLRNALALNEPPPIPRGPQIKMNKARRDMQNAIARNARKIARLKSRTDKWTTALYPYI